MKSSTFGLGFSRCKLIQTNLTATEDKVIMNLIRSVWIGGYSTKFCTERYRPKVQPLTLLNIIFDKAEQICASIVHFLLKAWNLAGSPSVILILILIVLSAKGISHHGGCVIVQVLVLRYNQGANVEWIKIVIIKSSGLAFLKMAHDGRFESLHWLLFNETTF